LVLVAENRAELRAVITDFQMPHMDGLTFVRVMKRMLPAAGVIVYSGRLTEVEATEFRALGVSSILEKPFTQDRLVEALRTVFPEPSVSRTYSI
jgi:DNA-binding NtrC family response regulator